MASADIGSALIGNIMLGSYAPGSSTLLNPILALSLNEGTGTSAMDASPYSAILVLYSGMNVGNYPTWVAGWSGPSGAYGSALSFTAGESAWGSAPSIPSADYAFTSGIGTIEFWAKSTQSAWGEILCVNDTNLHGWYFGHNAVGSALHFAPAPYTDVLGFSGSLADGEWHHVVAAFSLSSAWGYFDGALDKIWNMIAGQVDIGTVFDLKIGGLNYDPDYGYDGVVDGIYLYPWVLTADEVAMHFSGISLMSGIKVNPPVNILPAPSGYINEVSLMSDLIPIGGVSPNPHFIPISCGVNPSFVMGHLIQASKCQMWFSQTWTPLGDSGGASDSFLEVDAIALGRMLLRMKWNEIDEYAGYFATICGTTDHDWNFECLADEFSLFSGPGEEEQIGRAGWRFSRTLNDPILQIGDGVGGWDTRLFRDMGVNDGWKIDGRDLSEIIVDSAGQSLINEKFMRISNLVASANSLTVYDFSGVSNISTIKVAYLSRKSSGAGADYECSAVDSYYIVSVNGPFSAGIFQCWAVSGTTWTDYTTAINDETPDDVVPFVGNKATDEFYLGFSGPETEVWGSYGFDSTYRFSALVSTPGTVNKTNKGLLYWYYSKGGGNWQLWTPGNMGLYFKSLTELALDTAPSGWASDVVSGVTAYWLRCSLNTKFNTQPLLEKMWLGYAYSTMYYQPPVVKINNLDPSINLTFDALMLVEYDGRVW